MPHSKRIIIDADVARSAGETTHPVSSGSRKILELVINENHQLCFCPILLEEWKKHRSKFSSKWQASMFAKKRISIEQNPKLHAKKLIDKHFSQDPKKYNIANKDAHLIDLALHYEGDIISQDNNARNAFCDLSEKEKLLTTLLWFHPIDNYDFLFEYLTISNKHVNRDYYIYKPLLEPDVVP